MGTLELSNYKEKKQKIKTGLIRITQGFVEVGYELKQIRDQELYKLDGYGSITEFARAEYGLEHWDTSRFIAINDKYADGSKLLEQYEGYKYGLLAEMLSMSEEELKLVSLRTTRAEIRELKQAKREAESEGCAPAHVTESLENTQLESDSERVKNSVIPEGDKLLIEFFRDKSRRGILKELAAVFEAGTNSETMAKAAEIINPSGHMMFRNGRVVLIFGESEVKYSKFGGESRDFLYADLICDIYLTFDMSMPDPWVAFYGEPEPDPIPPKKEEKKENAKPAAKPQEKKPEKPVDTHSKKPEIQKSKEDTASPPEENLPGQMDITDYKECTPDGNQEEDIQTCRVCGCTDDKACPGGCYWVEDDLCSQCHEKAQEQPSEETPAEIVEADIIHTPPAVEQETMKLEFREASGQVEVFISRSKGVRSIRIIDTDTGESWEVTINA